MSKALCLAIAAFMLIAAPLTAQTTMPAGGDTAEMTAVKTVAKDFMAALQDKDIAVAKKLFAGTDADWKLVEVMHGMVQSTFRMRAASEKRWPEEVKNQKSSFEFDIKQLAAQIDKDRVAVTGDSAKLGSGMQLKLAHGQWKVSDIASDPQRKAEAAEMSKTIAPVFAEAADDVENGKYTSYADMQTSVKKKLQEIMMARMGGGMGAPRKATTMPSN